MRELWNSDIFVDDNTLSVNIARLRKKLAELGLPDLIATKKGVGYAWCGHMNKDDFDSLVPGFLTSWLGHRLIFLIAYAIFAVAILAYSSLFDIKRNLIFYAILLLSICWILALLWDFVRKFLVLEKSGVVRK